MAEINITRKDSLVVSILNRFGFRVDDDYLGHPVWLAIGRLRNHRILSVPGADIPKRESSPELIARVQTELILIQDLLLKQLEVDIEYRRTKNEAALRRYLAVEILEHFVMLEQLPKSDSERATVTNNIERLHDADDWWHVMRVHYPVRADFEAAIRAGAKYDPAWERC